SASLIMTVSKAPPGLASTLMRSIGALVPTGPQKWVRCSGVIMQRKTSSRGASKTLVRFSSAGAAWWLVMICRLLARCGRRLMDVALLDVAQVRVELVEPLGPGAPAGLDPAERRVERGGLEVARPVLGVPGPRDQPGPLEHLEVLGDARKRHVERHGQLVNRGIAPR